MAGLISALVHDEKPLLRALWRRGTKEVNGVLAVIPSNDEKSKDALQTFANLVSEVGVKVEPVEVVPEDFVGSVVEIAQAVTHSPYGRFILSLNDSAGVLNYEILTALLLLGIDAEVEAELSNGKTLTWRIKDMVRDELDKTDKEIIKEVYKWSPTISELARNLKMSTSTVWQRVNKLIELGYIERTANGLVPTTKGRIFAEARL